MRQAGIFYPKHSFLTTMANLPDGAQVTLSPCAPLPCAQVKTLHHMHHAHHAYLRPHGAMSVLMMLLVLVRLVSRRLLVTVNRTCFSFRILYFPP